MILDIIINQSKVSILSIIKRLRVNKKKYMLKSSRLRARQDIYKKKEKKCKKISTDNFVYVKYYFDYSI